eukprot:343905-Pyramimonas_sp.AAC.1
MLIGGLLPRAQTASRLRGLESAGATKAKFGGRPHREHSGRSGVLPAICFTVACLGSSFRRSRSAHQHSIHECARCNSRRRGNVPDEDLGPHCASDHGQERGQEARR